VNTQQQRNRSGQNDDTYGEPPFDEGFQGHSQMQGRGNRQGQGLQAKANNVCSYSFPGNHLLEVSLIHQVPNNEMKKHFFCFVKLLPGGKNGNNRTFISDKHITMKLSLDRTLEIAKALRAFASGFGDRLGPFTTFTDTSKAGETSENSNSGQKSLSLFMTPPKNNQSGPKVMLTMKLNSENYTFPMTPYFASSVADIVEKIAMQGLDLEMQRQRDSARCQASGSQKRHAA